MNVAQLFAVYMPERRRLLQSGVPVDGWTVRISPKDAADLELDIKEPIGGSYTMGATWLIDADVPEGEIHLDTKRSASTLFI